jgi:uncharacterized protein (DUF1501 family)
MPTTRRGFLRSSLASSSLVAMGAATVPTFLGQTAAQAGDDPGKGRRVLVVLQLIGGNDGLNTVVPHALEGYDRARRALRLPKAQLQTVTPEVGLHPGMGGLAKLLEDGALAIVQGVGYPNPDRSHFRSMEIWETARSDTRPDNLETGWLGRALDAGVPSGDDIAAIHLGGGRLPLALKARTAEAPSVRDLAAFRLKLEGPEPRRAEETRALAEVARTAEGSAADNPLLGFVRRSALAAYDSSDRLSRLIGDNDAKASYPETPLAGRLRDIARIIKAGFQTPIYYTTQDGYDTHANQLAVHAGLLTELSDAVAAFRADLKAAGQADRVSVLVFSEFGRRVGENASAGTDHGAAAPVFVVGPVARPGLVGEHPSLEDLDDGDLKHHTDFRRIYASVLADWLGLDPTPVLGPGFEPLGLWKPNA